MLLVVTTTPIPIMSNLIPKITFKEQTYEAYKIVARLFYSMLLLNKYEYLLLVLHTFTALTLSFT